MVLEYFKKLFKKLVLAERSPIKLAQAFCWGNFVALAPIPGFHTPLLFVLSWLLGLNSVVVFTVVYVINNPWTMLPIYAIDYMFGYWMLFSVMGIDLTPYDPRWMEWINDKIGAYLSKYLGITKLSLGYFLIGGFLIASVSSIVLYPLIRFLFVRYLPSQQDEQ